MIPQQWQSYLLILLSTLVALVLSVYPLPIAWRWWRPEFVMLVSIYWISVFPLTLSLGFLALTGLLQDLLEGVPLGEHGLSLIIIAYICIMSYQRVRNFSLVKESAWIFILVGLAQFPTNWVQSMSGRPISGLLFLAPALSSAILWPAIKIWLDNLSRHYRINP